MRTRPSDHASGQILADQVSSSPTDDVDVPTSVTLLSSAPSTMTTYTTGSTMSISATSTMFMPTSSVVVGSSSSTALPSPSSLASPGQMPPPPPPQGPPTGIPGPPPSGSTDGSADTGSGEVLRVPVWVGIAASTTVLVIVVVLIGLIIWLCRRRAARASKALKDEERRDSLFLAYDSLTSLTPRHSFPFSTAYPPTRPTRPTRPPKLQRPSTAESITERIAHGFVSMVRPSASPIPLTISAPIPIPTISLIPPSPSETMFTTASTVQSFESGRPTVEAAPEYLLPPVRELKQMVRKAAPTVGDLSRRQAEQLQMTQPPSASGASHIFTVPSSEHQGSQEGFSFPQNMNAEQLRLRDDSAPMRKESWFGYQEYMDSATQHDSTLHWQSAAEVRHRESAYSDVGLPYRSSQPSSPAYVAHVKSRNGLNSGTESSIYSDMPGADSEQSNLRIRTSEEPPISRQASLYDQGERIVWKGEAHVEGNKSTSFSPSALHDSESRETSSANLALWKVATSQIGKSSSATDAADLSHGMQSSVLLDPRRLSSRVVSGQVAPVMSNGVFRLTDSPSSIRLSVGEKDWANMLRHESSWSFLNDYEQEQLRSPARNGDIINPPAANTIYTVHPLLITKKSNTVQGEANEHYSSWSSTVLDGKEDETLKSADLYQLPPLEYDALSDFEKSFSSSDISVPQVPTLSFLRSEGSPPKERRAPTIASPPPSRIPIRRNDLPARGLGITSGMLSPPQPGLVKRRSLSSPSLSDRRAAQPRASAKAQSSKSTASGTKRSKKHVHAGTKARAADASLTSLGPAPRVDALGDASVRSAYPAFAAAYPASTSGGIGSPPPSKQVLRSSSTSRLRGRESPALPLSPSQIPRYRYPDRPTVTQTTRPYKI